MGFSASGGGGSESSGGIAADASEIFFGGISAQADRRKYGSYNLLVVTNVSTVNCLVELDQNTAIGIAPANGGSIGISETDGIFFDTVKVTNLSGATAVGSDEVKCFATRTEDDAIQ